MLVFCTFPLRRIGLTSLLLASKLLSGASEFRSERQFELFVGVKWNVDAVASIGEKYTSFESGPQASLDVRSKRDGTRR